MLLVFFDVLCVCGVCCIFRFAELSRAKQGHTAVKCIKDRGGWGGGGGGGKRRNRERQSTKQHQFPTPHFINLVSYCQLYRQVIMHGHVSVTNIIIMDT